MIGPIRRNTSSCWNHRHIKIANFDVAGVVTVLSAWSQFRDLPIEMQVKHFKRYYKYIKELLICHLKTQYPSGSKIRKKELKKLLNETLDQILIDCKRLGISEDSVIITLDSVSDEKMPAVRELELLSKLPENAHKTTRRKSQPKSPKKTPKKLRCSSSSAVSTISVPSSSESLLDYEYGPSTSTAPAKNLVDFQAVPEEAIHMPDRLPKQLDPGLQKLVAQKLGVFPKKFTTYIEKVKAVLDRTEDPHINEDFRFQCFLKIADVIQFDDMSKYNLFYVKYYKAE